MSWAIQYRWSRAEQADSSADSQEKEGPEQRWGEAVKKATTPEGNEEVLSDTFIPAPRGFPFSMLSSQIPLSLSPEPWQLNLGLSILREELLRISLDRQKVCPAL